jgi:predicted dehydrogenase
MTPLRVAVVGLNERVGRQVLPALAASPRARLVAVGSRDLAKAERFAEPYAGCRPFGSYAELLRDDGVDAVFVMTPAEQHAEMSLAALEAGRDVMCEKPLATTLAEARAMLRAAEARGRRTAVNFTYRSVTALRLLARALTEVNLGDLVEIEVAYRQGRGLLRPPRGAHVLLELGSHALDALLWWCDLAGAGEPRRALGVAAGGSPPLAFSALLELDGGAVASLQATRVALGFSNAIVARLNGRSGALALQFDTEGFELSHFSAAEPSVRTPIAVPEELKLPYDQFPRWHWDRIVGALRGEERFPGFRQGMRVQAVIEAALASAASGRREAIAAD